MANYYQAITKHQEKILSTFHMWTHLILTIREWGGGFSDYIQSIAEVTEDQRG